MAAAVTLFACSAATDDAPTVLKTATPTGDGSCVVDSEWISSPSLPGEVVKTQTDCDFERFAWQSMLYLVQPTGDSEILGFESWMPQYGIFVGAGDEPTPWGQHPPDQCNTLAEVDGRSTGAAPFVYSNLIKQAGSDQPLIDPSGQFVWYGLRVNESAYDMITGCDLYRSNCAGALKPDNTGPNVVDIIDKYPGLSLPPGAFELKTSWKVLTPEETSSVMFYSVEGWTDPEVADATGSASCKRVTLGLVGIHIVADTPDFPALIWATFEHRNNAPDCSDLQAKPPLGGSWNFFDPDTCDNCTTNDYEPGKPTQVCRMHPQGDSLIGTFPNGQDCDENPDQYICKDPAKSNLAASTKAINEINASAQKIIVSSDKIDPVWANYELVGNIWTENQVTPPQLQSQRGSLSAANTTMETFVQNGESGQTNPNNCFSCHNQSTEQFGKNLPPAGLSHLFHSVLPETGGCSDGALPAACGPYTSK